MCINLSLSSTFSKHYKTIHLQSAPMTCDVFGFNEKWVREKDRRVSKFGSWKERKNFSSAAISLKLMRANVSLMISDVRWINCRCFRGLLRSQTINWLSRTWKLTRPTRYFPTGDVIRREGKSQRNSLKISHYPTWINRFFSQSFFPPSREKQNQKKTENKSIDKCDRTMMNIDYRVPFLNANEFAVSACSKSRERNTRRRKTRRESHTKINIILDFFTCCTRVGKEREWERESWCVRNVDQRVLGLNLDGKFLLGKMKMTRKWTRMDNLMRTWKTLILI